MAYKISNIECSKVKELCEKDIKLKMENNIKSREDALVPCKLFLKGVSMDLHLGKTVK